ncbi:cell wall / vacuolar inhibitor of fructosidase 2 [Quercus suber]|uniref:Cell wall / vacuolar inhibitor of fructosidase 2 n=1 Tax=Quercus suber TaxID=58331 RepID=A0AAW0LEX1_QUESU
MASPISCLSILLILLLVTSLFYQISNAIDKAFLEKVCHKSFDYELCLSTLRSDERTSTADPNGLVLISIKMASPISCLSILLILLLVTSLFYQISNAIDKAFLEKVCHKSFDYELCLSTLRSDERTSTADPNGLVLISISINMNLANSTINRIPDILKTLKDPLDKTRLMNCQTDFIYVLNKLSQGYELPSQPLTCPQHQATMIRSRES